jgi:hypothetical protein
MNTRRLRARLERLEAQTAVTYTREELEDFRGRLYALTIMNNTPHGLDKKEQAEFARLQVICKGLNIYRSLDEPEGGYNDENMHLHPMYESIKAWGWKPGEGES